MLTDRVLSWLHVLVSFYSRGAPVHRTMYIMMSQQWLGPGAGAGSSCTEQQGPSYLEILWLVGQHPPAALPFGDPPSKLSF